MGWCPNDWPGRGDGAGAGGLVCSRLAAAAVWRTCVCVCDNMGSFLVCRTALRLSTSWTAPDLVLPHQACSRMAAMGLRRLMVRLGPPAFLLSVMTLTE